MKSLILVLSLMTPLFGASDVSGKWTGTFEPANNEGNPKSEALLLIFKQGGEKLTGSGGPNEGEQHPMREGKVAGDKVTFEVPLEQGSILFTLTVTGDQGQGEMKMVRGDKEQTAKVSLKRVVEK
jgi:hypothetical protein